MNIGIVSCDSTTFPNLALMKICAYHKAQGDHVEWANPLFGHYDRVYISKVFTFSEDDRNIWSDAEVVKGGTGYSLTAELPAEIDLIQPDYSLYPNIDSRTAYGFLTRRCLRYICIGKHYHSIK